MRIALRYGNNEQDAADITSDSFLRLFKYIRSFDAAKSDLHNWIKRIVINQAIDHHKKRKSFVEIEKAGQHESYIIENASLSHLDNSQLLGLVQQLIPVRRSVFNLYVIEGYSHKEIAGITGMNENTCKWHLAEAKKQLREMINKTDAR